MGAPAPAIALDPEARLQLADRFEAAYNEKLEHEVLKFARRRVSMLRCIGVPSVPDADDLLNDAVEAVLRGQRTWPPKLDLRQLLIGTIQSWTHEMLRGLKYPLFSLEDAGLAGEAAPDDPEHQMMVREIVSAFCERLMHAAEAKNDPTVLRLIEIYMQGTWKRSDVAAALGIDVREYDFARQRFERLFDELPASMVAEAADTARETK